MSAEVANVPPIHLESAQAGKSETFPPRSEAAADQPIPMNPTAAKKCGCSDPRGWDKKTWSKFAVFMLLLGVIL